MKAVIFAAALLLAGCASMGKPDISVSVNSLAAPEAVAAKPFTYVLTPGQEGVTVGDLQFQEFSRYVERALSTQGLRRTSDPEQAEVVILLSYAIGDPKTFQSQVSIPVFGQTGISSINTVGTISGGTYRSTTTATPTYGVTGYNQVQTSNTYYMRNARLTAYKKEEIEKKTLNQFWKVSIASAGQSGDLRYIFPYLITAALPYIGKNSGQAVTVQMPQNHAGVAALITP